MQGMEEIAIDEGGEWACRASTCFIHAVCQGAFNRGGAMDARRQAPRWFLCRGLHIER